MGSSSVVAQGEAELAPDPLEALQAAAVRYVSRGSEPGSPWRGNAELTVSGTDLAGRVAGWRERDLARISGQLPPTGRAPVTTGLRQLAGAAGEGYTTISRGPVPG